MNERKSSNQVPRFKQIYGYSPAIRLGDLLEGEKNKSITFLECLRPKISAYF